MPICVLKVWPDDRIRRYSAEEIEFQKLGIERASLNRFDIRGYANEALKWRFNVRIYVAAGRGEGIYIYIYINF